MTRHSFPHPCIRGSRHYRIRRPRRKSGARGAVERTPQSTASGRVPPCCAAEVEAGFVNSPTNAHSRYSVTVAAPSQSWSIGTRSRTGVRTHSGSSTCGPVLPTESFYIRDHDSGRDRRTAGQDPRRSCRSRAAYRAGQSWPGSAPRMGEAVKQRPCVRKAVDVRRGS